MKELANIECYKLLSVTTNRTIILESNILAKMQVAEEILKSTKENTLHFDGTSEHQKHFLGFQISTESGSWSTSMLENLGGDSATQLEECKHTFLLLAKALSHTAEQEDLYERMMLTVRI